MKTLRLAVLISGRGSNLQALIDACKQPSFPAEIAVVISNSPAAGGLAIAAEADIPAMIVDHTYFKGDKPGFENALAGVIEQHDANLVCLAGFMRILSADFLNRFKDKVINIHPSLLPAHKGLDTHAAVLKAGDAVHGCSVHLVTPGMDEGPVIAQRQIAVNKDDTIDTLAARVLAEEHILYADVIKKIATQAVVIRDGRVFTEGAAKTPAPMHANDTDKSETRIETAPPIRHHGDTRKEPEATMGQNHGHNVTATADQDAIRRSQDIWTAFVKGSLLAGGAVAVTLILMAAFLV